MRRRNNDRGPTRHTPPGAGDAVDPITLAGVDEVRITTLVDNVYDGLLVEQPGVHRAPMQAAWESAPQFSEPSTMLGMRAEHGFSVLLSVRTGSVTSRLVFDTGLSPDAMVVNADRLGVDLGDVASVVLSHGHFDHAGRLTGLSDRLGTWRMPMTVHPLVWTRAPVDDAGRTGGAAHAEPRCVGGGGVRDDRACGPITAS